MRDESKTKMQLIQELSALRQRVADMERAGRSQSDEMHYRVKFDDGHVREIDS
jgi:hypothetical protein